MAQVLALALWFAGTAAGPDMARAHAAIGPDFQALLTGAVQAGFVIGTLASAVLGLPDRFDPRRLFAACAVAGALANAAILLLPLGSPAVVAARLITGIALAGVYPVGMKLAVAWASRGDTGLVVGLPVGALTLGSALPHLVNALGGVSWPVTLSVASFAALLAAVPPAVSETPV
jgi:MFS family permease